MALAGTECRWLLWTSLRGAGACRRACTRRVQLIPSGPSSTRLPQRKRTASTTQTRACGAQTATSSWQPPWPKLGKLTTACNRRRFDSTSLCFYFLSLYFFCSFFSRIFPDRFQSAHLSLIKRWRTTCVRDCMHECTSLCACQWGGNVCRCGCVTQTERGGGVGRRGGSPEHIPAAWLTESPDAFWSDTFGVWSSVRPRWRVWTRRYSRACRGRARWSSCAGDRPARGTPE